MHVGRPKSAVATRHSSAAEEALELDLDPNANAALICVLRSFQGKLSGSNDYNYLLREFGNRGDCSKAVCCDRDRPASRTKKGGGYLDKENELVGWVHMRTSEQSWNFGDEYKEIFEGEIARDVGQAGALICLRKISEAGGGYLKNWEVGSDPEKDEREKESAATQCLENEREKESVASEVTN
ncbi:hypothetical protein Syun_013874 [Stephania yunnanensis]|uniref:Uncharacterized protein n=1 Tax=Stephania yunnanensis TaxID=152371 RepID=A0AAP0P922_9MAGN